MHVLPWLLQTRIINGRPLFSPSLWSGLSVAIMPAIPAAATFFTVYESAKRSAARTLDADPASPVPCIFAAAVAESFSCVVRVPFEQLKMRMQVRERLQRECPLLALVLMRRLATHTANATVTAGKSSRLFVHTLQDTWRAGGLPTAIPRPTRHAGPRFAICAHPVAHV